MGDKILQGYADLFPIGCAVAYFPIAGESQSDECEVMSAPWRLGGGQIVIKVTGRSGGVSVDHLVKLSASDTPPKTIP